MNRFARIMWGRPSTSVASAAFVLLALFVALGASAAGPSKTGKPVREAATIKLVPNLPGPEDHPVLTIGHAMVGGQCASDGTTTVTKVTITAVGGAITITGGGIDESERLVSGQKDAFIVIVSDVEGAASADFAVFDSNGPSFSGTAAAWETGSGCVITAQVAG